MSGCHHWSFQQWKLKQLGETGDSLTVDCSAMWLRMNRFNYSPKQISQNSYISWNIFVLHSLCQLLDCRVKFSLKRQFD